MITCTLIQVYIVCHKLRAETTTAQLRNSAMPHNKQSPTTTTTTTTMASTRTLTTTSTAPILLVMLLIVAAATTPAAAAAAAATSSSLPPHPSCLRDAAALCQGASTNVMTCLVKLAAAGDTRVSETCGTALDAIATKLDTRRAGNSNNSDNSRASKLVRLLTEAPPYSCTHVRKYAIGTGSQPNTRTMGSTYTLSCGTICCTAVGAAKQSTVCCTVTTATTRSARVRCRAGTVCSG